MVKGGQAAAYEPLQLRVLAYQARGNLIQARNRYTAAWKQLAAAMGVPGSAADAAGGSFVDSPVPFVRFDIAASPRAQQPTPTRPRRRTTSAARTAHRRSSLCQPRAADVLSHVAVQKDNTTPPFGTAVNIASQHPMVPVFDRNQGNIEQAEGACWRIRSEGVRTKRATI